MKTRGLLRDTAHLSIGQGFRLVIQAAYFFSSPGRWARMPMAGS